MKVLLISPNIETLPDPVFPLGTAAIAGTLNANHIPYRILDLCFVDDYPAAIAGALAGYAADVVGISIRNVDNVCYPEYSTYLPFYRQVVRCVRRNSEAAVVLGGSGFSLLPGALLEHLGADWGIAGEGESLFLELLQRIEQGDRPDTAEERVLVACPAQSDNLDDLPAAERTSFDSRAYLEKGGMGNIQTKRGCPFGCIYCTYPLIEGPRVRTRNPGRVVDEMAALAASGMDNVFVVDNEFNYPVAHAEAICREMIERGVTLRWSCYANPAHVTADLVQAMKTAGCSGIEFGCDAAHNGMLAALGKNFSVDQIREASRICREREMPFCHSLLLGGPGETMASIQESLDVIRELEPTAAICMVGIRVFPGTRLARIALEEGRISAQENFLDPVFYLAPEVAEKILPFIRRFAEENPTWIFPGLNININPALQAKLRRFGIKGPLWELMRMGRRRTGRTGP
jgi:radical SAM superfamily enzyme YgiQ (UPF0313 family)